jgi:hypothetical protein
MQGRRLPEPFRIRCPDPIWCSVCPLSLPRTMSRVSVHDIQVSDELEEGGRSIIIKCECRSTSKVNEKMNSGSSIASHMSHGHESFPVSEFPSSCFGSYVKSVEPVAVLSYALCSERTQRRSDPELILYISAKSKKSKLQKFMNGTAVSAI